jgi:hypothetical protein
MFKLNHWTGRIQVPWSCEGMCTGSLDTVSCNASRVLCRRWFSRWGNWKAPATGKSKWINTLLFLGNNGQTNSTSYDSLNNQLARDSQISSYRTKFFTSQRAGIRLDCVCACTSSGKYSRFGPLAGAFFIQKKRTQQPINTRQSIPPTLF